MTYARGLFLSIFESSPDIMSELRDCVTDKNHPDNYWVSNFIDGRVKYHHCEKNLCICWQSESA